MLKMHRAACRAAAATAAAGMLLSACSGAARQADPAAPQPVRDVLDRPALMSAKANQGTLLAVTRAGQRLVAAGERGIVLLSDDDGRTWSQAQVPVSVLLTAIHFVDAKSGWAVGHGGVVLHSSDGGSTWTLQLDGRQAAKIEVEAARKAYRDGDDFSRQRLANAERFVEEGPDKPFLDVHFVDRGRGLIVGAYGLAFSTDDGGRTWTSLVEALRDPSGRHLYEVSTTKGVTLIAGESGAVYRRPEGALSFSKLESPYGGSFFGALALPSGDALLFGLRGNAFRLTPGSDEWRPIEAGTIGNFTTGMVLADGRVLLCDDFGRLHLVRASVDRAVVLEDVQLPSIGAVAQASDESIVLASVRGTQRVHIKDRGTTP
jgi:photosystem II stability/assembly factor-like uncharacterized protein